VFRRVSSLCLIPSQLNTIYNLILCFFEVGTEYTNMFCFKELKGNFGSGMGNNLIKGAVKWITCTNYTYCAEIMFL